VTSERAKRQVIEDQSHIVRIQPEQTGKKPTIRNFVLIVVFAIALGVILQEAIGLVVQGFLDIPPERMALAVWGDTFLLRILASLVSTAAGALVIGTFLASKARTAALIAVAPTVLFWLLALVIGVRYAPEGGLLDLQVRQMVVMPVALVITSPLAAYYGSRLGESYRGHFDRPRSVLNIKWYHWLWMLPFFLGQIVSVLLFTVVLLIRFDFTYGTGMLPGLVDLIFNLGYLIGRVVLMLVLIGIVAAVHHAYSLLTEEAGTSARRWKKGAVIFAYVVLFHALRLMVFGQYL